MRIFDLWGLPRFVTKCSSSGTKGIMQNVRDCTDDEEEKGPWHIIGIDIAGPFKTSSSAKGYIIAAIDLFTKFAITDTIPDQTAITVAKFIFEQIICKFGVPFKILFDQATNFNSELKAQLCALFGIAKIRTTAYHPKTNGEVERLNKIVKQMLASNLDEFQSDWDVYLPALTLAYNTAKQASIDKPPYEALFGREFYQSSNII